MSYIDEESLAVEQVGELIQSLGHDGFATFWDLDFPCDHGVVGAVFGGQEEIPVSVGLIVQKRDPGLAQVIGGVLHLYHQV